MKTNTTKRPKVQPIRSRSQVQAAAAEGYDYLLRGIDLQVWEQFKGNADRHGFTSREAMLELVNAYAAGSIILRRTVSMQVNDPMLQGSK